MATYFIKTGGNDSLDGLSDGNAWATIAKVTATTLTAGDTVQFKGGDSFSGNGPSPTISGGGNPASPVTFTSYGTGKATLTSTSGNGLYIQATSGIEVTNLIVRSTDTLPASTTYGTGIVVDLTGSLTTARSHFYVTGCEVYNFSYAGIACWGGGGTNGAGWDDVRVTNCHVEGNQAQGIVIANTAADTLGPNMTNVYVADCVAVDNPGTGSSDGIANQQGNGILLYGCDGGTVERCLAHGNATAASGVGGGGVGIMLRTCTGTIAQWNECYDQGGLSIDGTGLDCDISCSACILQYNYTHGNRGGGLVTYSAATCIFRYNVSENDGRACPEAAYSAINIYDSTVDCYGNTVWTTTASGNPPIAVYHHGSGGLRLFNNILITSGSGAKVLAMTAGTVNGNAYWQIGDSTTFRGNWGGTDHTTLASFRTASSQETGTGYNVDPLLLNAGGAGTIGTATVAALRAGLAAYRPTGASPIAGQGLDLDAYSIPSPGTEDFFGATLPGTGLTTLGAGLEALSVVNCEPARSAWRGAWRGEFVGA